MCEAFVRSLGSGSHMRLGEAPGGVCVALADRGDDGLDFNDHLWQPPAPRKRSAPQKDDAVVQRLLPGGILALDTGRHRLAGSEACDHPALQLECFDFLLHKHLLAHQVLIAEHVTDLETLRDKDVEIVCAAVNITSGDGDPHPDNRRRGNTSRQTKLARQREKRLK
jgi:hypothetical protein